MTAIALGYAPNNTSAGATDKWLFTKWNLTCTVG